MSGFVCQRDGTPMLLTGIYNNAEKNVHTLYLLQKKNIFDKLKLKKKEIFVILQNIILRPNLKHFTLFGSLTTKDRPP